MTLRERQSLFARCVGIWIGQVYERGYELTFGDAARTDKRGHMPKSKHYRRLALDANLFVEGEWIDDGSHPAWVEIGAMWEAINPLCRWGGHFGDANHLELLEDVEVP